jgi:hypothetical protein
VIAALCAQGRYGLGALPLTTVADIAVPAGWQLRAILFAATRRDRGALCIDQPVGRPVDFLALLTCSRSLARGAVHARGQQ